MLHRTTATQSSNHGMPHLHHMHAHTLATRLSQLLPLQNSTLTCTGRVCPMRCALSMACSSVVGFHLGHHRQAGQGTDGRNVPARQAEECMATTQGRGLRHTAAVMHARRGQHSGSLHLPAWPQPAAGTAGQNHTSRGYCCHCTGVREVERVHPRG